MLICEINAVDKFISDQEHVRKNNLRFESTKTVEFEEFREINISRCKRGCVNEKLDKAEILNLFREQGDHMANNMNHIHRLQ